MIYLIKNLVVFKNLKKVQKIFASVLKILYYVLST